MAPDPAIPVMWWLCPNTPRCPHASALHDVEDMLGGSPPTCTVDGCYCGHALVRAFVAEMAERDPGHQWFATLGHSFGDPDQPLVFNFGRTDPRRPHVPQPFAYVILPEVPPEGAVETHAELFAMTALDFAERFDAGQVDQSGAARPDGGDPPGCTTRTSPDAP